MVEELLLGDNPFIGVSHLAHAKAREVGLNVDAFSNVVVAAYKAGATGFTFSTHPVNLEILRLVASREPSAISGLNYYPLVPYAMGYVRRSTTLGLPGLALEIARNSLTRLGRFKWLFKAVARANPSVLLSMQLERDLAPFIKLLPKGRVRAILMHEVLTEVMIAHRAPIIYETVRDYFGDVYGVDVGVETRNVCSLRRFTTQYGLDVGYVMTPLNRLGYQMTPDRSRAEGCIERFIADGTRVIAINILASGALTLEESMDYVLRFNPYGVAIGTSRVERARDNFRMLRKVAYGRL